MPQYPLRPDTLLNKGRYQLGAYLGLGGFGITYRAVDTYSGRQVAIKEFYPQEASRVGSDVMPGGIWKNWVAWDLSPETRQRYEQGPSPFEKYRTDLIREAQKTAQFHHPNIVDVYGSFEENNTAYLVMQYIEGDSLQQYVNDYEGMRLPIEEILLILKCIGEALHYAHLFEIMHRDVTPNNILRERSTGHYFLIDFGLAREFDSDDQKTLTVFATKGYAPPEQYNGKGQGPHSDVYSLSAVAYFLTTGRSPMKSTERTSASGKDLLRPPHEFRSDLPEWFENAILKGMSLNPAERPATIMECLSLLTEFAPSIKLPARVPYQSLADMELTLLREQSHNLSKNLLRTTDELKKAQQDIRDRESKIAYLHDDRIKAEGSVIALQNERDDLKKRAARAEAALKAEPAATVAAPKPTNSNLKVTGFSTFALIIGLAFGSQLHTLPFNVSPKPNGSASRIPSRPGNTADDFIAEGDAYSDKGRYTEAESAYRRAITVNPSDAEANYDLGFVLSKQQHYKEAEDAYRRAIALKSNYAYAFNGLGAVLKNQHRYKDAELACRQAIKLKPDFADAYNNLGNSLHQQEHYNEAESAYRQAIKINPSFGWAYANLAANLLKQNRRDEALEAGKKSRELGYRDEHPALTVLGL